jgi:hypothetical protein
MNRNFVFALFASALLSFGCYETSPDDGPNDAAGGESGVGGQGGPGSDGGDGGAGANSKPAPVDCAPEWDPADTVQALGRVRPDGSDSGVMAPNPVNIGSVELLGAEMQVQFKVPLSSDDYVILTSPVTNNPVVTFVPYYVPHDLTPDGFKVALYNYRGEPRSWNEPTSIEIAFVVY